MLKVVEISDEQINNCLVFLNRANLTGAEAEAMVMIKNSLKCGIAKSDYLKSQNAEKSTTNK